MKRQIKKLWVAALRSGEYRQGKNQLRTGKGSTVKHCCLGVLEDLAIKAGVRKSFPVKAAVLTDDVLEWAGLPDGSPLAGGKCLASENDFGESFKQIANRIEKYL